jgi:hypothetical protein
MNFSHPSILTVGFWVPAIVALVYLVFRWPAYLVECFRSGNWRPLGLAFCLFLANGIITNSTCKTVYEGNTVGITFWFSPSFVSFLLCIIGGAFESSKAKWNWGKLPSFAIIWPLAFLSVVIPDYIQSGLRIPGGGNVGGRGLEDGLVVVLGIALVIGLLIWLISVWRKEEAGKEFRYLFSPL